MLILFVALTVVSVFWYLAASSSYSRLFNTGESGENDLVQRLVDFPRPERLEPPAEIVRTIFVEEGEDDEDEAAYVPVFANRIVHLDLKGAPPKVRYLKELFLLLKQLGATGILLEYEDVFPYRGSLGNISAANAWSPADVQGVNLLAEENRLEIIPLVQTFGHLEFVLKLDVFQHLREVKDMPPVICPSEDQSLDLLFAMLRQVAEAHPKATKIHIGADEVYSELMGKCDECRQRMALNNWMQSDLFLSHVARIASFVREELKLQPLMWDDEFRSIGETELHQWKLGQLVGIVVWNYQPTLQISADIWSKYVNVFDCIWVASAFKGATGSDQVVTNIRHHMQNHQSWMDFVSQYRQRGAAASSKFQGIMMTGWQRFDHFSVLCELLPVSLPSLAYNLLLMQHANNMGRIDALATRLLRCQASPLQSTAASEPEAAGSYTVICQFPGAPVWTAVQNFVQARQQYWQLMANSVVRGWMTDYQRDHQFSNPIHMKSIANELTLLKYALQTVVDECRSSFQSVYVDHFTADEWLATHVQPIQSQVDKLIQTAELLSSKHVWPRRPLHF